VHLYDTDLSGNVVDSLAPVHLYDTAFQRQF